MQVNLRSLQPNPFRDFDVDPIDKEQVKRLRESIKEDGFWGGVVCREMEDGTKQIAAGHHRIEAALAEGITRADLTVVPEKDMDDAAMVRIYARENATQRSNIDAKSTAGSVQAAIMFVAKALLTNDEALLSLISESRTEREALLGHLTGSKGLGEPIITRMLAGAHTEKTVREQLANLKKSGDYARKIEDVRKQIEQENAEALKEAARIEKEKAAAEERERKAREAREKAEADEKAAKKADDEKAAKRAEEQRKKAEAEEKKAAEEREEKEEELEEHEDVVETRDRAKQASQAAASAEVTFDFSGVSSHFKNSNQVSTFRELVTGQGVRPYLDVSKQAALAESLVKLAAKQGVELTGTFIRTNLMSLVLGAKHTERKISAEEKERARNDDLVKQMKQVQGDFSRNVRGMILMGVKLAALEKKWPEGLAMPITSEFREALKNAKKVITDLNERV